MSPSRPLIALLAAFQPFEADPAFSKPAGHYAVWLSSLFHALKEQSACEIHWITLSKLVRKPRRIEAEGQIVHILPRSSRTLGQFTLYAHDRWVVARELKLIRPNLVHAWGTEDCYALCGADFQGKKLLSVQGLLTACIARGYMPRFAHRQSLYERKAIKAYEDITAESPWARERVHEIAPKAQVHALEYAVEQRFFDQQRELSAQPSVLYAGSDTPLKNVDTLIDAFRDPRLRHVTLNLAGVSEEKRPGLPDNIRCLGRLSRDEIVQRMQKAWGVVHASLVDTGPTVVKEARVMGLPIILSSECGSKQYVEEGKSGFILEPTDTEGFIRSVLAVTRDQATSLAMGAHGHESCRRALCAETMCAELQALYSRLLS